MVSVSTGLISGLDTASLIDSLIAVEANPQTLLKNKLTDTKADAAAYRAVNTKFDALRAAAEALTKTGTWNSVKAQSSSGAVTATTTTGASAGSLTFTVTSLAARHTVVSDETWTSSSDPFDTSSPLVLTRPDGSTQTITLPADATLDDAISAINAQTEGLTATALNTGSGGLRLQVSSTATGQAQRFDLGTGWTTYSTGTDATLHVGPSDGGFGITSPTNTFGSVLPGVTMTVSEKTTTPVTVDVVSDPEAITAAVQKLVTAANAVLSSTSAYTDADSSTAVLKGDSTLRGLANQVLEAVSGAIGGTHSAAQAGIQLDRYGSIVFDSAAFTKALTDNSALAQRLVNGTGTGTTGVPGVAQRLLGVAKAATDATTGSLVLKAEGQDELATDLQKRIEDWDLRLEIRRATLTRQFTAMETALASLQNQSSWLSSQLKTLPSSSS